MLQCPTGAARLKDDGIAAKFVDAHLHRRARAQTRIEKDEGDGLARECFPRNFALELDSPRLRVFPVRRANNPPVDRKCLIAS